MTQMTLMLGDPRGKKSNRQSKRILQGVNIDLLLVIIADYFSRVEIYYQTLNVQSITQSAKYTVSILIIF